MGMTTGNGFERYAEMINALPEVPLPTAGQVGFLVVAVGLGMAIPFIEKTWWPKWKAKREAKKFADSERKRKEMRMKEAMDIREVRLQEMLTEMIGDGLLTHLAEGHISGQEYRRLLKEFGDKMSLTELLSTKSRKAEIKDGIIRRMVRGVNDVTTYTVDKCGRRTITTNIPGPKPGETTSQEVGKAISKGWSSSRVAS